jgi:putative oxidoreductase
VQRINLPDGWLVLRLTLALLIAIHGWARWAADGVAPFGQFLSSVGFPAGIYWAAAVTAWEILATPVLATGRYVRLICFGFVAIYATGIVLVHWSAGWFVVGLGRNGMEYSVLLITCLLCVAAQNTPKDPRTPVGGDVIK